ncbi:STAS domain-containing protein [Streptomyces sp. NPDC050546]|uniref:STAS domain-containing protein n=1 Tax=Streptomyces sp. NPDC050546 TaxID=3365628 RepID=UPI0037A4445F
MSRLTPCCRPWTCWRSNCATSPAPAASSPPDATRSPPTADPKTLETPVPPSPQTEIVRILPATGPNELHVALVGDLDYEVADDALGQVLQTLRAHHEVRHLRLDCRELDMVDSMGLTVLLQIHRNACENGVLFHLDNTGPVLRRLLHLTGTYEHLTTPAVGFSDGAEAASEN